jgi:hypothetical protein
MYLIRSIRTPKEDVNYERDESKNTSTSAIAYGVVCMNLANGCGERDSREAEVDQEVAEHRVCFVQGAVFESVKEVRRR